MITWNYIHDEIKIVLISKIFAAIQLRFFYLSLSYLNTAIKAYKNKIWADECSNMSFNTM